MNSVSNNIKLAVIVIARNEERFISKTLNSLLNQVLKPYRIIVVNDGSTDRTEEIVKGYEEVEIVSRKDLGKPLQAKKELANTINAGLAKLTNDVDCNYVMKLDADIILPNNYLSTIIERMESNPKIVISSGIIKGEYSVIPRGAGRVVKMEFWKKLGLRYPVNYSFEGYLVAKAKSLGFETPVYHDLELETKRKTGSTYQPQTYFYYGVGMKALGYTLPYVLIKVLELSKRKPKASYYMLKGFFSENHNLYEKELRDYVKKNQFYKLRHLKFEYFRLFFKRFMGT